MDQAAEMTVVAISTPGGPEVLQLRTDPTPRPGPGEVLIRVAGSGINAPDLQQRRGRYDPPPGHSPIPGLEVSGEIVQLGDGAALHRLGDHVVALCNGGLNGSVLASRTLLVFAAQLCDQHHVVAHQTLQCLGIEVTCRPLRGRGFIQPHR